MKNYLFSILFCLMCFQCIAQFGPQQVISTSGAGLRSVFTADFDGDGDQDVLVASEGDEKVAWFENLDGLGTFGPERIITIILQDTTFAIAADIDGDGDMDVVATSKVDDRVVWFKNLDGLGTFSQPFVVSTFTIGALAAHVADIDGDGDMDVFTASFVDNKIAWNENVDGFGFFGPQQIITASASSARDVFGADIDGDNDMDVLAAAAGSDEVLWFENTDGLGTFGTAQIITNTANGVLSVYAIDIDGDDDMDVLAAATSDDKVIWFENQDGLGTFGSEQIITSNLENTRDVYACDLDNDGDMDVLSGSPSVNRITWYENTDGLGNFGAEQIISTDIDGIRSVFASDIDGDGDMDVLSASIVDSKVAWYENLTILGNQENATSNIVVYPNPTSDLIYFKNSENTRIIGFVIYDVLGKKLLTKKGDIQQVDLHHLPAGWYFMELQTKEGLLVEKVIKE